MPSFLFLSEQQTQELITHLQVLSHCWWLAAVRRSADPLRDHPPSRHRPDSEADVGDDLLLFKDDEDVFGRRRRDGEP